MHLLLVHGHMHMLSYTCGLFTWSPHMYVENWSTTVDVARITDGGVQVREILKPFPRIVLPPSLPLHLDGSRGDPCNEAAVWLNWGGLQQS